MREIKFRGYSKSFSMMFDYDMLEMASAGMVDICKRELKKIDPEATELQMGLFLPTEDEDLILMQYTGLKDKNGIEIYEGDILNYGTYGNYKVVYNKSSFKIQKVYFLNGNLHLLEDCYLDEIEVIGNIYENSELLEKVKIYL